MKYPIYILLAVALFTVSCKKDYEAKQLANAKRMEVKNDSILKQVSSNWNFDVPPLSEKVKERIGNWNEWARFTSELETKPTGTINAYRQKTENLINTVGMVKTTVPPFFSKPQLRSRISVLDTKIKSLNTYINLDEIKCDMVIALVKDIARETGDIQRQIDEMIRFSEIPKEQGEQEMLRARDTTRLANPDAIPQPSVATPQLNPTPQNIQTPTRKRTPFANKTKTAN